MNIIEQAKKSKFPKKIYMGEDEKYNDVDMVKEFEEAVE